MWLKYFFFGSFSGLAAGFVLSQLLILGYFVSWQPLPISPAPIAQFVGLEGQRIFVRATDGTILSCYPSADTCWKADTTPVPQANSNTDVLPSCQLLFPMRILTARLPKAQACIQGHSRYPDGYADYAFILDPYNQIWVWYHSMNARFEFAVVPLISLTGTIVGFVIGGILAWQRRTRNGLARK